jgi:hypothetical protein
MHSGAPVLEQLDCGRDAVVAEEAEGGPLQEGHRDMQQQLFQLDPFREDEPPGPFQALYYFHLGTTDEDRSFFFLCLYIL